MWKKINILIFILMMCLNKAQQTQTIWYDTDNGLPQNSVKDIIKDKYGFIWLSTENGIAKFDGLSFNIYNKLPLHNNRFSDFSGKKNTDSIFNISSYSEDKVLISKMKMRIHNNDIQSYNLKIGNRDYCSYHKNGLVSENNTNMFITFDRVQYFMDYNSIFSINKKGIKKVILSNLKKGYPDKIFCDKKSIYIISTENKHIIKITNNTVSYLKGDDIFFKKETQLYWSQVNEQCLLINNNSLYEIDSKTNFLKLKKIINYDFGKESISSIYYDKEYNSVYIGTISKGLNIIKLNNFFIVKKSNSLDESIFYAQTPISNYAIITSTGDIYSQTGYHKNLFKGEQNKYFINKDKYQNFYTLSSNGLELFYKNENYQKKHTLINNKNITNIYLDENTTCIALMKEYGKEYILQIYDSNNFKNLKSQFLFKSYINVIKKKGINELIVGTSNGLYIINYTKKNVHKINYKKSIQVREIIETQDKNLWIFTYGNGFYLYKDNSLVEIPTDEKGRLLSAHSLQEYNGDFWISTNDGLFRVSKKKLIAYTNHKNNPVNYYRYSKEDGLKTNEFNGGCIPSSSKLENGQFVFPSMNGLVFFNPKEVKSYYPSNFYINTINFYDKKSKIDTKGTILLENNYRKTEVLIDVPYYANNENLIIESKIANSEYDTWERVNSNRKVLITGLSPGEYSLKIRILKSADGEYIYKNIKIKIKYLFYQTLAFRIFSVLSIALLVLLYIKYRIKNQLVKNLELEKIIALRTNKLNKIIESEEKIKNQLKIEIEQQNRLLQTISHDIVTPAKYMAITTKKIHEIDEKDYTKYRKYFEALYRSSHEFYNFIKTLKEYAEIYRNNYNEKDVEYNLNEIILTKKLLFEEIAKTRNTSIIFDNENENYYFSNKNIIGIIVHNIIDNSVKNTYDGKIKISITKNENQIIIEIADTGTGMSEEQIDYYSHMQKNIDKEKLLLQKYGLGLHLVLQLLQLINGQLEFKKNYPTGTIALIKLIKINKI